MRAHTVGCDDPVIQPPSPGRETSHRPHVETGLRPESSPVCKACGRMMLWASGRCAREVDQHEESRALVSSNRTLDIKEGQAIHVLLRVRRYDRCSIAVRRGTSVGFHVKPTVGMATVLLSDSHRRAGSNSRPLPQKKRTVPSSHTKTAQI